MVIDVETLQEEFQFAPKSISFELSKFDGTNPKSWIAHAELFFKFYQTEDVFELSWLPETFQKTLQDVARQLALLADQVNQLNKTNDEIGQ
ncbi:hypothetical protein GQ457_09G025420 [Hibiscus cannabinus]